MTFQEFFSSSYLFDPVPNYQSRLYIPFIALFAAMIMIAIALKLIDKKQSKKIGINLSDAFFQPLVWGAAFGYVYLFSRYEGMAWVGSRFFLVLILLSTFIWIAVAGVFMLKKLPKVIKEKSVEDRYQKYLPKKKNNH